MEEFTGLYGVDIAVKKLRPGADFVLLNTNFLEWKCPNNTQPPTWDDICEQIEKDKSTINSDTEV